MNIEDLENSRELFQGAKDFGIFLSNDQVKNFLAHNVMISNQNHRMNLTSVTNWEEAQIVHYLDSLSVHTVVGDSNGKDYKILDVGTGAGFPGIPLAIVFPNIHFTLLEATRKKVEFLKSVISTLNLDNVDLISGRSEELAHEKNLRGSFDMVVSRAVAPLRTLIELTVPFLKLGGQLVAQKSEYVHSELIEAENAIATLGLVVDSLVVFREFPMMPPGRTIVVMKTLKLSSNEFPRRPGIPSKKPL